MDSRQGTFYEDGGTIFICYVMSEKESTSTEPPTQKFISTKLDGVPPDITD